MPQIEDATFKISIDEIYIYNGSKFVKVSATNPAWVALDILQRSSAPESRTKETFDFFKRMADPLEQTVRIDAEVSLTYKKEV
jgi:hypothetical protein